MLRLACLLSLAPTVLAAQDMTIGQAEFMNSCAQCHGADGKGNGTITPFLTVPPPDLSQIQKGNGGVFPVAAVYGIIDGSGAAGVHGTTEMPAWGRRYAHQAPEALGWYYGSADAEEYVRGRILALVEHIALLQE
ncbi:cytochrome c [Halovulum dunhuangense]|uniref:Cytochrome c n=1 Tax=Halovulum dunhuangense TaxID=1505036 RepID=A0A849L0G8_9RHOB|nr:c-type cytochrome [Halovulum dunhuangense]NNU79762.1 cytochrome c [Halovulum dunhuangense]